MAHPSQGPSGGRDAGPRTPTAIINRPRFPADRRGFAPGRQTPGRPGPLAGSFARGLVIGGVACRSGIGRGRCSGSAGAPSACGAPWVSYRTLHDTAPVIARPPHHTIDWWGNLTFGFGLIGPILVGINRTALHPYGGHTMGWTRPRACSPPGPDRPAPAPAHRPSASSRSRVREPDDQPAGCSYPSVRPAGTDGEPAPPRWAPRVACQFMLNHLVAGHLAALARLRVQGHPNCVARQSTCCRSPSGFLNRRSGRSGCGGPTGFPGRAGPSPLCGPTADGRQFVGLILIPCRLQLHPVSRGLLGPVTANRAWA